ncbi:PKD domain-containing protein [Hymenobacter sp. HD11105]
MTYTSLKRLPLLLLSVILLAGCEKEIVPVADFDYAPADQFFRQPRPIYPARNGIKIINNTKDGESYQWEFGDGTTSTEAAPVFGYAQSGTYTIKLTTTSSTGERSVISKPITVVDRVLKRIIVRRLNWNAFGRLPTWNDSKRAALTIEIGTRERNTPSTVIGSLIYRSTPLTGVANTETSFEVPVTSRVVLNNDLVGEGVTINVLGDDTSGKQLVFSSGGSGVGLSAFPDLTRAHTLLIQSGALGTAITLECGYE